MQRHIGIAGLIVVLTAATSSAQIEVFDPFMFVQTKIIEEVRGLVLEQVNTHADVLRRMARGISLFTDKGRWIAIGMPLWRTRHVDPPLVEASLLWFDAINSGDPSGVGYEAVAAIRNNPQAAIVELERRGGHAAADAMRRELATIDLEDSAAVAGMDQTGQIRRQRRSETDALAHLEDQVHDPNLSGGAVADVLSGAALIRVRQRNTQTQLSRAIAEQLLADAKRDRDTDVAVMNMRFARQPANEDDFDLATGSAAVIDGFHLP